MGDQQFEQTLEAILSLRAERRILSSDMGRFQIPDWLYLTLRKKLPANFDVHSAAHAYVAALPVFDYEKFKKEHPDHPYSTSPQRGSLAAFLGTFCGTVPDTAAALSLGTHSYVQTHLDSALIVKHVDDEHCDIPLIQIPQETYTSFFPSPWGISDKQNIEINLSKHLSGVSSVYHGACCFLDEEISSLFSRLSSNSVLHSLSLQSARDRDRMEAVYRKDEEDSVSFSYLIPHLTEEDVRALDIPFAFTLEDGILQIQEVDLHNKEQVARVSALTCELERVHERLQKEHSAADVSSLEADLHTYRHAFYDAHNTGEYVRALKGKLPSPQRKWYAGPAVLEVEDVLQAAYHLAAEKQKQCEEEVQRQQKYLRERYGILRFDLDFSHPCNDYFESSKVHFKDCVIEDASHKQLVTKTVAQYTKIAQKGD